MTRLRLLPWDSDFFGFGVARIDGRTLHLEEARTLTAEADARDIECIYFEAAADSAETWHSAHAVGFEPIDIRVALDASGPFPVVSSVLASGEEEAALLSIVREGVFGQSRFFRDRRFPAQKALEMFEIWLRRGLREPGWFTVAEAGGFAACDMRSIQLVAVSRSAQGTGIGMRLISAALAEFERRGVARVEVVTQGGNIAALRTYAKAGFKPFSTGVWFHRWRARP